MFVFISFYKINIALNFCRIDALPKTRTFKTQAIASMIRVKNISIRTGDREIQKFRLSLLEKFNFI